MKLPSRHLASTEAIRLARETIKNEMRKQGVKLSTIRNSEINRQARDLANKHSEYYNKLALEIYTMPLFND